FPVGHAPVVLDLLPMGGVDIVVDHSLPKSFLEKRRVLERLCGLPERIRNFLEFDRTIGIADKGLIKFQLFIYALQARCDKRCKGQIWSEISTTDAAFDADAFRAFAAKAETCSAVILAPHDFRRRKSTCLKALVGIDVWRQEIGVVGGVFELSGHPGTHERRHSVWGFRIKEERFLAIGAPDRIMHVAGASSLAVIILGHEGD